MLSMLKPDLINQRTQIAVVEGKQIFENSPRITVDEDISSGLYKTHGQSFETVRDGKRPISAHLLPTIRQEKVK